MYTYAKGSQADSDKDWYHGELTKDQAEEALRGGGSSNCFLVRESNGSLVLSLRHHDIKHIKIERGPGWYQLEHHIQSPEKRFSDLNELVSHYCINGIESTSLGIACKKISHHAGMRRLYNCTNQMQNQLNLNKTKPSGMYSKGSPADIVRYHWYHGKITENEATSMLNEMSVDSSCFLVRQAAKDLILSVKAQGLIFHVTIDYTPAGYRLHLQGREEVFKTIPEMITHYLMFPIDQLGTQTLGTACNSQVSTAPLSSPLGISHPWENKTSDAQDAEGYEVVDRILLSKLPPPPWFSTTSLSSPISPSNNIRQRAKTLPYNKHLPPSVHTSSQQEHKKKSEPRSLSCSLPEYSTHITCQQQHSQRRPPPPPPPSPPPPPPPSPPPPLPLRKSHKIPTRRRWSSATSSFYSPLEEQEWYWGNTSGSDYQKILEKITKRGCQPPPLPPKNSKIHKPLPPPPTHGEPPPRNILHEPPTRGCINTVVERPLPQMSGTEEFDGHLIAVQLDLSRDMPHLKQSNLITAAQLNLSRDMPHLKESNWMNPSLSREESRKRLTSKCNGTFLVRPKAGVDDGSLLPAPTHSHTIDIIHQGIFKRIPIFRDPNGGYGFSPPYEFDSLSTLVLYYATNTMEKHNPDFETTLMYPAFCP